MSYFPINLSTELETPSDARQTGDKLAGTLVMPNIASGRNQRYAKDLVF